MENNSMGTLPAAQHLCRAPKENDDSRWREATAQVNEGKHQDCLVDDHLHGAKPSVHCRVRFAPPICGWTVHFVAPTNPLPRTVSMISIVPCHTQRQRGRLSILSTPVLRRLRQDLKLSWPERRLHDAMFHAGGVIPYGSPTVFKRRPVADRFQSSQREMGAPLRHTDIRGKKEVSEDIGDASRSVENLLKTLIIAGNPQLIAGGYRLLQHVKFRPKWGEENISVGRCRLSKV